MSGNGVAGVGVTDEWGKGIEIFGAGAVGNKVVGNFVGTDSAARRRSATSATASGPAPGSARSAPRRTPTSATGPRPGATSSRATARRASTRSTRPGRSSAATSSASGSTAACRQRLPRDRDREHPGAVRSAGRRPAAQRRLGQRHARRGREPGDHRVRAEAEERHGRGQLVGTNLAGDAITAPGGATGNAGIGVALTTRTDDGAATDGRRRRDRLPAQRRQRKRRRRRGHQPGDNSHVEGNYIGTNDGHQAIPNDLAGISLRRRRQHDRRERGRHAQRRLGQRQTASASRATSDGTPRTATASRATTWAGRRRHDPAAQRRQRRHRVGQATGNVIGYERTAATRHVRRRQDVQRRPVQPDLHNGSAAGAAWASGCARHRRREHDPRQPDDGKPASGSTSGTGNVTENDVDDADTGGNGLLNFPVAVTTYRTSRQPEARQRPHRRARTRQGEGRHLLERRADPGGSGEGRTWEAAVTTGRERRVHLRLRGRGRPVPSRDHDRPGRATRPSSRRSATTRTATADRQRCRRAVRRLGDRRLDYDGDGTADLPLRAAPYSAEPGEEGRVRRGRLDGRRARARAKPVRARRRRQRYRPRRSTAARASRCTSRRAARTAPTRTSPT